MLISRRRMVRGASAAAAGAVVGSGAGGAAAQPKPGARRQPFAPPQGPRARVLIVNDLSGDIDGLFATTHALMSRSTEVRGIVGARAREAEGTAALALHNAREILRLMGLGHIPSWLGGAKLADADTPVPSEGARAIVSEAMRADTDLPLYVTVGSGLSEVASALLMEPRVAGRFTLVWIGGSPPPKGGDEYNFDIDPIAAQVVFNRTTVPIWQVPSDVYASCVISASELQAYVAPYGAIGAWLYQKLLDAPRQLKPLGFHLGETYTLGDSPLVLLTALTDWLPTVFEPPFRFDRTGSSHYEEMFAPLLAADGTYTPRDSGRRIRVYRAIDTRLMFSDFFAKMRLNFGA
jgi:inosine-uridine nucleoside N-ribohydrolase